MRTGSRLLTLTLLTLLASSMLATAVATAGGPLILFDPPTQTPYAYTPGVVRVYTDLGPCGILPNATADGLTANGYAEWTSVPTAYLSAAVVGDFGSIGLPDITGGNANLVIGPDNGGGIHVIYDTDGSVTNGFLGAPPGVLGIATPEYSFGASPDLKESWVVINGATVNPGDPAGGTFAGVFTHEEGHSVNLAHTQTNGAVIFFGDDIGPTGCLPPYGGGPGFADTETMYPFIDVTPGSTGAFQRSIEHPDDETSLSNVYPDAGWPAGFATFDGRVFDTDGITEVTGVNVIARNTFDPFADSVSALSGDFTQGALGPDGRFTLNGLTPNTRYTLYIDEIVAGGFSTPPSAVPTEEWWNILESSNPAVDDPCDYDEITVAANQTVNTNIIFQGVATPEILVADYCVTPERFRFTVRVAGVPTSGITVFRIAADDPAFTPNSERISVNFDGGTGVISFGPVSETLGVPSDDRWADGVLTDFSLTNTAIGEWLIEGSVAPASNPFVVGDLVRQTALRTPGNPDVYEDDVRVTNCAPPVITTSDYCVFPDGTTEFAVVLENLPLTGTAAFRIAADDLNFSGNDERVAVNFDPVTGVVSFGPVVQTFGVPSSDRWLDGPLASFSLTPLFPGGWELKGSMAPGAIPFAPGDQIRDTLIRTTGNPDVSVFDVPISDCRPPNLVITGFGARACSWPGDLIGPDVWVRIRNDGGATGVGFQVGLYLAPNPNVTVADDLLVNGLAGVPPMNAGVEVVVPFPAAEIPAAALLGSQFMGVIVDVANAVPEADETDNMDSQPICINRTELGCATAFARSAAGLRPVSLPNQPSGNGQKLTNAFFFNGIIGSPPAEVDATVSVELLDAFGSPLAGVPENLIQMGTTYGRLVGCPNGTDADAPTNAAGITTFSGALEAGGYSRHSMPLIDCNEGQVSGDGLSRGFYIPSFPGSSLDRVDLYISANAPGPYTYELTARRLAYDGPVLGTAQWSIDQSGVITDNKLAIFKFDKLSVLPGDLITFELNQVAGPGGSLYAVAPTAVGCGVVQTQGTAPPLDVFRRDGIRVRVFGAPPGGPERTVINGPIPFGRVVYDDPRLLAASRNGELFWIDYTTGVGTPICTVPVPDGCTEIAYDMARGNLVWQDPNGTFTHRIVEVANCDAGTPVFNGFAFNGLVFIDGELYGTGIQGGCGDSGFFRIDPLSGGSALIGPTGLGPISGLAYDELNCTLYGVTGCPGGNPVEPSLVWIDLATGVANIIGALGAQIGGLEVAPNGELYGGGNQTDGGNFYRIDRITGAAGLVGPTGFASVHGMTLFGQSGLNIFHNSPDINGNLVVALPDVGNFSDDLVNGYNYRSDYIYDCLIDLKDVGRFASAIGDACPGPVPPIDVASKRAAGSIGVYFDLEGHASSTVAEPGQVITAHVLIDGEIAKAGISAFEFAIETSDNVELGAFQLAGAAVNLGEAPDFVAGAGGLAKAEEGGALRVLSFELVPTDDQPVSIWLRPSSLQSGGERMLAVVQGRGEDASLRAIAPSSGGGEGPVATINGGEGDAGTPTKVALELRNVPNPFNPATEFRFNLDRRADVEIRIYDVSGRNVRHLNAGALDAGAQAIRWNGTDDAGSGVGSGIYFYRLIADGAPLGPPQKMTLLK